MDPERRTGTDDRPDEHRPAGGHGSGPGCGPKPSSRSIAATAGTSSGVVAIERSTIPLPGRPGTAVLPMCSTTRSGSTLIDELGDGLGDLERPGVPWLDGGRPSLIRADRGKHRAECRLRPHATRDRTTDPRGGRRVSPRSDRPGRPGDRGSRHRRRPCRAGSRRRRPSCTGHRCRCDGGVDGRGIETRGPPGSTQRAVPRRGRRGASPLPARRDRRPRDGDLPVGIAASWRRRPR